jgi:hypothetical protein
MLSNPRATPFKMKKPGGNSRSSLSLAQKTMLAIDSLVTTPSRRLRTLERQGSD